MRRTICCVAALVLGYWSVAQAADPGAINGAASPQLQALGDYGLGIGTVKLEQYKAASVYRTLNVLTLNGRPLLLQEMNVAGGSFTPYLNKVADYLGQGRGEDSSAEGWHDRLQQGTYRQILLNKLISDGKAVEGPIVLLSDGLEPSFVEKYFDIVDRRGLQQGRINFGKSAVKGGNEFQRERNWQSAVDEMQASLKTGPAHKTMTVTLLKTLNMGEYDMKLGSFPLRTAVFSEPINKGSDREIRLYGGRVLIRPDTLWPDELRCPPDMAEKLAESIVPVGGDKRGRGSRRILLLAMDLELTHSSGWTWSARHANPHVYRDADFTQEISECKLGTRNPGT